MSSFSYKGILSILFSVFVVSGIMYAEPPTPPSGRPAGGLFSVYFKNIIGGNLGTGTCPPGQVIVGFNTGTSWNLYGVPVCQTVVSDTTALSGAIQTLSGNLYSLSGVVSTLSSIFSSLIPNQWSNYPSNTSPTGIYYPIGNVGIGVMPTAGYKLDVNGTSIFRDTLRIYNANGAYSYIVMSDDESPNGVKYIHANSNNIGFLNGGGSWISRWDNNGNMVNNGTFSTSNANGYYVNSVNYYGDGTNGAVRMPGDFYIQKQNGAGSANVIANDYYIATAGKWASQLSTPSIQQRNCYWQMMGTHQTGICAPGYYVAGVGGSNKNNTTNSWTNGDSTWIVSTAMYCCQP